MPSLANWLNEIGLGQYAEVFAREDINFELLPTLSEQDLKELGLSLGHRRTLIQNVRTLTEEDLAALGVGLESCRRILDARSQYYPAPGASGTAARDSPRARDGPRGEAERRQLTIMFCDLVDSTAISARLDPEDLRDVMSAFRDACCSPIEQFGGFVARYIGDGILAYFGYPEAHEDDAERAVRAGLQVVDAMARLNAGLGAEKGIALSVRIGIETGYVVVGDIFGDTVTEKNAVVGESPNVAARLLQVARPGTVVVGAGTKTLIGRRFSCTDLGEHQLKGIEKPARVWQVVGIDEAADRLQAVGDSLTPLVGRQEEMERLTRRWEKVISGRGQVVLIAGQAGIGKSRLLEAFQARIADQDYLRLRYQCSPYFSNTALYPVARQLEQKAKITSADSHDERLAKLTTLLSRIKPAAAQDVALLANLLALKPEGAAALLPKDPRERRAQTLETVSNWLEAIAEERPLLLIFEDLQWMDPTTTELFHRLVEWSATRRVLLVATIRSDRAQIRESPASQCLGKANVSTVDLNQIEAADAASLVHAVAGGKTVPARVVEEIVIRADGVPLYIEELTRALLDSDLLQATAEGYELKEHVSASIIPTTLRDSLMARLDRAGPAKEVAQLGAVLGREFPFRLVARLSNFPETKLEKILDHLAESQIIVKRGDHPNTTYAFKHVLLRDAAYDSLLKSMRRQLHLKLARALENNGESANRPELIAHHYSRGGAFDEAIAYWRRAAQNAFANSAHVEAANHLQNAIGCLAELDERARSPRQELELVMELAAALRSTLGYAAANVEQTYLKARELCESLDSRKERFNVEWGLMQLSLVKGDIEAARDVAESLFDHAERHPDRPIVDAHLAKGMVAFHLGDFKGARSQLKAGLDLCDNRRDSPHLFTHGQIPGVFCQSYLAWTSWFLGCPDTAKALSDANVEFARKRSEDPVNAYSYVSALAFANRVYQCLRDPPAVNALATQLIEITKRSRYAYYEALGMSWQGWAKASAGEFQAGIDQMLAGLSSLKATGTHLGLRGFLVSLAELYAGQGMLEEALIALEETAPSSEDSVEHGTHAWDAEIERVRAMIALGQGDTERAEAALRASLEIAERQCARSIQLRTSTALAELLHRSDRREEARQIIEEGLEGINEGADTADFHQAHALIDRLS